MAQVMPNPKFKQEFPPLRLQVIEQAPKRKTKKPPILFVHGAYCAAWVWQEYFMPWFAQRGHHCYALSLRGHGESAGHAPINTWSLRDYVTDLHNALAELPQTPVLVGHSMGAVVVQKLLEKQDFPAAVLMAPSPPDGLIAPMMQFAMPSANMMSAFWGGSMPDMTVADVLFANQTLALKTRFVQALEPMESVRVGMDMSMGDTVVKRGDLDTPITVLGAEKDSLVPLQQLKRTAARYGVEPQVVPAISHAMMLDKPWQAAAEATLAGLSQ